MVRYVYTEIETKQSQDYIVPGTATGPTSRTILKTFNSLAMTVQLSLLPYQQRANLSIIDTDLKDICGDAAREINGRCESSRSGLHEPANAGCEPLCCK